MSELKPACAERLRPLEKITKKNPRAGRDAGATGSDEEKRREEKGKPRMAA
jgi:hypothetical protein